MAYVVELADFPTYTETPEARTYTVVYRVCVDTNPATGAPLNKCALLPRAINSTDIPEFKEIYDVRDMETDFGASCEGEVDFDAVLTGVTSGAFEQGASDSLATRECMPCRLFTATYTAEKFLDSNGGIATNPQQAIALCPRVDVIPVTRELPVEISQFMQFLSQNKTAPPTDCSDLAELVASACGNYTSEAAPVENVCHPFVNGQHRAPMLPNGIPLDLFREQTEKIIRIRKYFLTYGDAVAFGCHENKVNDSDVRINIPCVPFDYTFPERTLYLRSVGGTPINLNSSTAAGATGGRVWDREYELHFRLCGWDDVIPIEGVERAICVGEADQTFDKDDCDPGKIGVPDCFDEAIGSLDAIIPASTAIRDFEGNPIRTKMNLDPHGRPLSRQAVKQFYMRWRNIPGTDFTDIDLQLPGAVPP